MAGLTLIIAFTLITIAGEALAIGAGIFADSINENVSLLVFFLASVLVVAIAWPLALRITPDD